MKHGEMTRTMHKQRESGRPPATDTLKNDTPGCFVLNKEKTTVKLNKHVIITKKTVDRKEMLSDVWNMEDVAQFKR